jgi:hypothetical protein
MFLIAVRTSSINQFCNGFLAKSFSAFSNQLENLIALIIYFHEPIL